MRAATALRTYPVIALAAGLSCLISAGSRAAAAPGRFDDEEITQAVQSELILDEAVPAHLIDVSTSGGVVTLSGSVSNLLAEQRAAEVAQTIRGVRSVVNTIELKPVARTDRQIRKDVHEALLEDPATERFQIGVKVNDGVVTLEGEVDSYAEKMLCTEVVRGVRGVEEIENTVTYTPKPDRSDAEIETEIRERLEHDVWVDDGLIEVEVEQGEAILTGTAGSASEKARASQDAYVAGVASVDDSGLEVDWTARDKMRRKLRFGGKTQGEIEKAVEAAFLHDPRVRAFDIEADVEYATVTLTGTVDNLKAKRAAEKDAENTVGVLRVRNFLKVRPATERDDREIAEAVRRALRRDPYVERYEIAVTVSNGKAYLDGSVDSHFEREQAEDVASRVRGVAAVQNGIEVTYARADKADWEILDDVRSQLEWSPFVDSENVNVSVVDGVATLFGTVEDWRASQAAETNAVQGGAERVINKLKVQSGPRVSRP